MRFVSFSSLLLVPENYSFLFLRNLEFIYLFSLFLHFEIFCYLNFSFLCSFQILGNRRVPNRAFYDLIRFYRINIYRTFSLDSLPPCIKNHEYFTTILPSLNLHELAHVRINKRDKNRDQFFIRLFFFFFFLRKFSDYAS